MDKPPNPTQTTADKGGNLRPAEPWKPGQSGNPNGRPLGTKNKATELRALVDLYVMKNGKNVSHPLDPSQEKITWEQRMYFRLLEAGDKGKVDALKEIFDILYGKNKDKTEITGLNDGPIEIVRRIVKGTAPTSDEK